MKKEPEEKMDDILMEIGITLFAFFLIGIIVVGVSFLLNLIFPGSAKWIES